MVEIWKDIEGFDGVYSVSSMGRVISRHSGTEVFLKLDSLARRYVIIGLTKNRKSKTYKLHRVVAMAFHKDSWFEGAVVNHKDANPLNNRADNLEWCTTSQNIKHAFNIGNKSQAGEKNAQSKYLPCDVSGIRKLFQMGMSRRWISETTGVSRSHVTSIISNKRWSHL